MLPLPLPIVNVDHLLQSTWYLLYFHLHFTMQINFPRLLVVLLGFSYVLSVSAIPATRTQNLNAQDKSALPSLAQLDIVKLGNGEEQEMVVMEEGFIERRIDLEIQDYGGTGANRDHDPITP